jgi:NDP-sugar pyrophosphorylase family protein
MDELGNVVTVILAGRLGTRLRSVVADRRKVLARIGGKPFLTYLLDQLVHWKVREVVVCTAYLGDQVKERFGPSYERATLAYSREAVPMGTGGALRLALPNINSDTVLVLDGDSYCAADLGAF